MVFTVITGIMAIVIVALVHLALKKKPLDQATSFEEPENQYLEKGNSHEKVRGDDYQFQAQQSPHTGHVPPLTEIGELKAFCPYCDVALKKMPGKKTKCRVCGNFIYVRTRPIDQNKVLIREDQIEQIEEQWAIANGTYDDYIRAKEEAQKRLESARNVLTQRFGKEPSDRDVQWYLFNQDLFSHIKQKNMGFYSDTRMKMAICLEKDGRFKAALRTRLEVFYLDLNGPANLFGEADPDLLKDFPPWNVGLVVTAPSILKSIVKLAEQLNLSKDDVRQMFMKIAEQTRKSLKTPVTAESAWSELRKANWPDSEQN